MTVDALAVGALVIPIWARAARRRPL